MFRSLLSSRSSSRWQLNQNIRRFGKHVFITVDDTSIIVIRYRYRYHRVIWVCADCRYQRCQLVAQSHTCGTRTALFPARDPLFNAVNAAAMSAIMHFHSSNYGDLARYVPPNAANAAKNEHGNLSPLIVQEVTPLTWCGRGCGPCPGRSAGH